MRDRPILFSGPMIQALLAGRKTQTRRAIKDADYYGCLTGDCPHERQTDCDGAMAAMAPYGVAGDLLWVRESHRLVPLGGGGAQSVLYADDIARGILEVPHNADWRACPQRPSIHMPRWASRLTLAITEVRVQRLHDITEEDARAEGVFPAAVYGGNVQTWLPAEHLRSVFYYDAKDAYMALWDHINGDGAAAADPWVFALTFEVHRQNVDDYRKTLG